MDVVIRNGTLITPASVFPADVGVIGERIAALSEELEPHGAVELDATGCYVLPGGIDPHVHLQMPVGDYVSSDDFTSGTVAAALGGTTTVIDFVEPEPGEPLLEALEKRCAEADGHVAVDYGLHMTIPTWYAAHGDYGEPPHALAEVVAAGVPSFKLYLAYEGFRLDDAQLYRVMKGIVTTGGLPIIHCENGPICETLRAQAVARGNTFPIYHALTRPPRQEAEAVSRAIDIAALAGSYLYVVRGEHAAHPGRPCAGGACLRRDLPPVLAAERGGTGPSRRGTARLLTAAADGGGQRGAVGRAGLRGPGRAGDRPLPFHRRREERSSFDRFRASR